MRTPYLVLFFDASAACLLHALLVKKLLLSKLGEKYSQRLVINSALWLVTSAAATILSFYLVFFEAPSRMLAAFL